MNLMEPNWKMRDGTRIHTSEMSDNHAQNALNMVIAQFGAKEILTIVCNATKVKTDLAKEGNIENCFKEEELREMANDMDDEFEHMNTSTEQYYMQ